MCESFHLLSLQQKACFPDSGDCKDFLWTEHGEHLRLGTLACSIDWHVCLLNFKASVYRQKASAQRWQGDCLEWTRLRNRGWLSRLKNLRVLIQASSTRPLILLRDLKDHSHTLHLREWSILWSPTSILYNSSIYHADLLAIASLSY